MQKKCRVNKDLHRANKHLILHENSKVKYGILKERKKASRTYLKIVESYRDETGKAMQRTFSLRKNAADFYVIFSGLCNQKKR